MRAPSGHCTPAPIWLHKLAFTSLSHHSARQLHERHRGKLLIAYFLRLAYPLRTLTLFTRRGAAFRAHELPQIIISLASAVSGRHFDVVANRTP